MTDPDSFEMVTELGRTVRLHPFDQNTLRLALDMEQDGDGRHAEVLLNRLEVVELVTAAANWVQS